MRVPAAGRDAKPPLSARMSLWNGHTAACLAAVLVCLRVFGRLTLCACVRSCSVAWPCVRVLAGMYVYVRLLFACVRACLRPLKEARHGSGAWAARGMGGMGYGHFKRHGRGVGTAWGGGRFSWTGTGAMRALAGVGNAAPVVGVGWRGTRGVQVDSPYSPVGAQGGDTAEA